MKPHEARALILRKDWYKGLLRSLTKEEKAHWTPKQLELFKARDGWGYIQPEVIEKFDTSDWPTPNSQPRLPLNTLELLLSNTWFEVHPEKVLGTEKEAKSLIFPIATVGKISDLKTSLNEVSSSWDTELEEDPELALAKDLGKLLNERLRQINRGFSGLDGLGELSPRMTRKVSGASPAIKAALQKSAKEKDFEKGDVLDFDQIERLYNSGITPEEKKAWVWYKRTMGEPMTGWKEYFLSGRGKKTRMVVTAKKTILRDTNGRILRTAPTGTVIGKLIEGDFQLGASTLNYVRTFEGKRLVSLKTCKVEDSPVAFATDRELHELVLSGALYYLEGELVPFPVYAYGNMYDRELQIKKDEAVILELYGQEILEQHQRVVAEARPELLSVTNTDRNYRPVISLISSFASEFQLSELRDNYSLVFDEPLSLVDAFVKYTEVLDPRAFSGTSASNIKDYYIEGKRITGVDSRALRTNMRTKARNEGERLFSEFLHTAILPEDQRKIDYKWNRLYNGQSSLAYSRIPIGFSCSAKFKQFNFNLRPAQREGVAFINAIRSGIIAYDVGVGKTMTAIISVAEALMTGRAKRPLIVVPNPTYKKWMGELVGFKDESGEFVPGVLSYTGIKVNDWYNLSKPYRKSIPDSGPVDEKSITIVTFEGFKRIGFSEKVMEEMLVELANTIKQPSDMLTKEVTARSSEIDYAGFEEAIGVGVKGTLYDIDSLGFDKLVIDEAHRCKNIFDGVKKDGSGSRRYSITGATSELGRKAFFLCNYVQRTYGGNVLLLTATPFTNSPLEIFSMLSLVALHSFQAMNIRGIHDFFNLFVRESEEMVVDMNGKISSKSVVKGFNNRLILQKLIYNHISYKTGEEAGIKRPCKINLPRIREVSDGIIRDLPHKEQRLTYLSMTARQSEYQEEINDLVSRARDKFLKVGMLFKAMSQSLDNALSPFLYPGSPPPDDFEDFVEESPKILYTIRCIESVKKFHEQRNEAVSGQVIYINRGKRFFPMIKQYLVEKSGFKSGVKWGRNTLDEVEIISSGMTGASKERIKEAFLAGVVKVIIGTATIREGIDLQKRSTVLYNLYPDWNPTDIRQLEGRVWRQGNRHGYVRVVMPLVQDSMDVFVFQKLEEKTARINDIWYRADRGNVLDLESLDPQEIKMALLSDPLQIVEMLQNEAIAKVRQEIEFQEHELGVLKELGEEIQTYQSNRKSVLQSIRAVRDQLSTSPSVTNPKAAELMRMMSPEARKGAEQEIRLFGKLKEFFAIENPSDKQIIISANRIKRYRQSFWGLDFFKELVTKVRSAERTILKKRGMSLSDPIPPVIENLEKELAASREEVARIQSPEHTQKLRLDVLLRKDKMKIAGSSIRERLKDFEALNYLMEYRSSEVDNNDCVLPQPGTRRVHRSALDDELILARALQLQLQLRLRLANR